MRCVLMANVHVKLDTLAVEFHVVSIIAQQLVQFDSSVVTNILQMKYSTDAIIVRLNYKIAK